MRLIVKSFIMDREEEYYMRSVTFRLTIAIITFLLGLAVTSVWFFNRPSTALKKHVPLAPRPNINSTPELGLQPEPDDPFGHNFEPSITCEDFSSSTKANRAFRKELNNYRGHGDYGPSSKILSRIPKLGAGGRRLGERAVAIACCGVEGQQAVNILWTYGRRFCGINAPTVERALEFEKVGKY